MYPNVYYALKDLFGIEWRGLQFINMFGVFIILSFFVAAFVLHIELRRKCIEGLLNYEEEKIIVGKTLNPFNLLINFLIGFLFGYKLIGAFLSNAENPQDYIKSLAGNWPGGIILGLLFAASKWYDVQKNKLPIPEERTIKVWPYDRIADLTALAAIFGFAGAKIFNSLETWDYFVQSPFDSLFSFSGLTFYGGLICAAIAIWWYARKHHISFWNLNDAAAPALILAYAVGRIGCQVSGDGDWGIPNTAYISTSDGKVVPDTVGQFANTVHQNQVLYTYEFGGIDKIRHLSVKAPSFLPDWLFAYAYPHNVNNVGIKLTNCVGQHCNYLPTPVFPTPIYETIMGLIIFGILWYLRKRLKIPGVLFSIYLILNGLERFIIEKIRVNTEYNFFRFRPTQAELISSTLILVGLLCFFELNRRAKQAIT
jgi:phosphatidylglycerol---prolipoprotein diacylglyceryl transferase